MLHLTGIVLLGGTTFLNYIISRQLWGYVEADRNRAVIINSTTLVFGRLTGIGGAITILSGVAMVAIFHGVVASQLWFRIKMILVLLIIINSLLFARPQSLKLKKLLPEGDISELSALRKKSAAYYAIQLAMFLSIILLSVFRFG